MQAVVAGEVEIASDDWDEIVYDFEKVLIVELLIFFMVIMQYSSEDADNTLGRLEKAAKRRQDYARMRGNTSSRISSFLLGGRGAAAPHFRHLSG